MVKTEIARVHKENYGVYGVRKIHAQLNREQVLVAGRPVARCTTARLMKTLGLRGICRAKGPRTTVAGTGPDTRPDLVKRTFTASCPDRLWVADITYVRTFAGWVYCAFVLDVFSRRVVGWQISTSLRTDLALDALNMGLWTRQRDSYDTSALVHHSDRGSQGGFNRSSQHLIIAEVLGGTTAAAGRSGASPSDAFTGTADPGQACGARILAVDRERHTQRGGRRRGWRVSTRRVALVSSRWRHAATESGRADRPLLVVQGA